MTTPFVHLHVHSQYSLLDGANRIDDLVAQAVEHRMNALALTDHGNLFGAVQFYQRATKAGVKPIIGVEAYIAPRSRFTRESFGVHHGSYHLILLATNYAGYKNLLKLVSAAHLEGFYYRPRIDKELLAAHAEGLIGLSACLRGEIPSLLADGKQAEADAVASQYNDIFGRGRAWRPRTTVTICTRATTAPTTSSPACRPARRSTPRSGCGFRRPNSTSNHRTRC